MCKPIKDWLGMFGGISGCIWIYAALKADLTARIGTSSLWRSVLGYLSAAGVGAVALWATSFFASCSPAMTPEQVQQWDAAHVAMHATTGTTCTLRHPVTVTPTQK